MAERKIGGKTYKVDPLTASVAIELYGDIIRVLGPASGRLPAIIVSLTGGEEHGRVMADVAAIAGLSDIFRTNGSAEVRDLIKRIVEIAMVQAPSKEWRQVDLDGDFTGNLAGIMPVAKFVLEEQYRDFFTASAGSGILGTLRAALQDMK